MTIVFALAVTGQPTLLNQVASWGGVASAVVLVIGLMMMRGRASPRASAGFMGLSIAILVLEAAYAGVDPITTPSNGLVAFDVGLVLIGDVAALAGGLLLGTSLGPLTGGSGPGRASGYTFLAGGILQMVAGMPDVVGIVTNSTSLGDIGHALDAVAGLVYVVLGPILLYLAVRRLRKKMSA